MICALICALVKAICGRLCVEVWWRAVNCPKLIKK